MENGEIVRFDDSGSFQISLASEGAETKEKFHSSTIKKVKMWFRRDIDFKDMLRTLKFEKAK